MNKTYEGPNKLGSTPEVSQGDQIEDLRLPRCIGLTNDKTEDIFNFWNTWCKTPPQKPRRQRSIQTDDTQSKVNMLELNKTLKKESEL